MAKQTAFLLRGLMANNPLGFLAALGVLRTTGILEEVADVKMQWVRSQGRWCPRILVVASDSISEDWILSEISEALRDPPDFRAFTLSADRRAGTGEWADKLRIGSNQYRDFLERIVQSAGPARKSRYAADVCAAWGTDACVTESGEVRDTPFQFTAGNQRFLAMVRELIKGTSKEQLSRSIFGEWKYAESSPSMRWDPLDETRRYALQAFDPTDSTKNPVNVERGANRLAIEGLALLYCAPVGVGLGVSGVCRNGKYEEFSWPVWEGVIGEDVVRSLIAHREISKPVPNRNLLSAMGVAEIYRSRIVRPSGRYRAFTPAWAV